MIEVRGVSKRYGSTVAVDELTFDVLPGRVTGFLGPNGAGKTTTMRMILGLDRPTRGTVTVLGRPYREHRRPLHAIGAVLDANAAHGGRSARTHLLALAQSNGLPASRVQAVLELVGLSGVARKRIGTFSLGMRQRLGMAGALLGDPSVVLCDEPLNGLDPEGIRWVRTLLRDLAEDGRTVFVSSHLMSEMALMADHVIVVGRGRLLADSSVAELLARSAATRTVVRTPQTQRLVGLLDEANASVDQEPDGSLTVSGLDAPGIGELAARHGIALHELAPLQVSLEAAFLDLTDGSTQFRATGALR